MRQLVSFFVIDSFWCAVSSQSHLVRRFLSVPFHYIDLVKVKRYEKRSRKRSPPRCFVFFLCVWVFVGVCELG